MEIREVLFLPNDLNFLVYILLQMATVQLPQKRHYLKYGN